MRRMALGVPKNDNVKMRVGEETKQRVKRMLVLNILIDVNVSRNKRK